MFFVCFVIKILLSLNLDIDEIQKFNFISVSVQVFFGIITYFAMLIVLKDDYIFKFFGKIKNILFRKKVEEE